MSNKENTMSNILETGNIIPESIANIPVSQDIDPALPIEVLSLNALMPPYAPQDRMAAVEQALRNMRMHLTHYVIKNYVEGKALAPVKIGIKPIGSMNPYLYQLQIQAIGR
jgi:hypothetical protein